MLRSKSGSVLSFVLMASCACQQPAAPPAKPAAPATATAPSSGASAQRLSNDTVIASWTDGKLTYGDLMAKRSSQFRKMKNKQIREQYDFEQREVGQMLAEELVKKAATAAQQSPEEFMRAKMGDFSVTDQEIADFYSKNSGQIGAPLEAIRGQLKQHLEQQKFGAAQNRVIGELMAAANLKIEIPMPQFEQANLEIAGRPVKGKPDAKVTVAVFSDFQCPYCSRAAPAAESLVAAYPNDVKVVFYNYPLDFHPMAMPTAIAGHCAQEQGKFWEFHDIIFRRQGELSLALIDTVGQEIGLDGAKFKACREDPATQKSVAADQALGESAGVEGTPSFFINGTLYPNGAPSADAIKPYIQG